MDVIARLPGCVGQAADAVSAYTQVKMKDAPKLLKIPTSEGPDFGMRLRQNWPKQWSNIEDLVVLLERNVYEHPVAGLLWERPFERFARKPIIIGTLMAIDTCRNHGPHSRSSQY